MIVHACMYYHRMIRFYLLMYTVELYRDYEGGKLLQVGKLGTAKDNAGTVNYVASTTTKREYLFFE